MALVRWNRVSDGIEEYVAALFAGGVPLEYADGEACIRITEKDARAVASGNDFDPAYFSAVWNHALKRARDEISSDGPWRIFLCWLALRRMSSTVYRVSTRMGIEARDVEAELLTCFIEGLSDVSAYEENGENLVQTSIRRVWDYARKNSREIAMEDIGVSHGNDASLWCDELPGGEEWDLYVDPPIRGGSLNASIRFTESQIEGMRIGALADRMGIKDAVYRARRPSRGPMIGKLSLRPRGSRS